MISREQFLARTDQELAMLRDKINDLVAGYASNMEHVTTCDNCQEVDNVTSLVGRLIETIAPMNMPAVTAVAVKMLYDERENRTSWDTMPSLESPSD